MAEDKMMRLSLVAKQINVGISTIVQYLSAKGHKVDNNPNTKLNFEQLKLLAKEYRNDSLLDNMQPATPAPAVQKPVVETTVTTPKKQDDDMPLYFRGGSNDASAVTAKAEEKPKEVVAPEPEKIVARAEVSFKVLGKIELDAKGMPVPPKPVAVPTEPKVEEPKVESVKVEEPKTEPVIVPDAKIEVTPVPAVEPPKVEQPKVEEPKAEVKAEPLVVAPTKLEETPKQEVVVESKVIVESQPQPTIVEEAKPVVEVKKQPEPQPEAKVETPKSAEQKVQHHHNQPQHQHKPQQHNQQNQNQQNNQQRNQQNNNQGHKPNHNQSNQNKPQNPVQQSQQPKPQPKRYDEVPTDRAIELIEAKGETLKGLTVLGKIELPVEQSRSNNNNKNKKKRKRIKPAEKVTEAEIRNEKGAPRPKKDEPAKPGDVKKPQNTTGGNTNNTNNNNNNNNNKKKPKKEEKEEVSDKQIQEQIKATMARLQGQSNKSNFGAKERREKRKVRAEREERRQIQEEEEAKILKVTEFISASELASLMDASVNEVISTCMSLGMFVSINQRLEADVIAIIAEEFGYEVQFVSAEEEVEAALQEEEDAPESLELRAPIVTIMGHVDHGKTSLLDYIRRAKVAAGEAGGITQHIGAYSVKQEDGRKITFLDTPGHEAFTAMRARGAKITDVVIIVIAADDAVMPQTEEAINHALVAGVPIVFAFSKIDKPGANTDRIREQLAAKNLLVEEWGGKYQTQEISSKSGLGVNELLEKVLLEAELLELKANANKRAVGSVIEASLDKGRGYVANILVQAGTLHVGDMMLAGAHHGRVKAMFDYRGKKLKEAGPSTPVQVLGLSGAPAAGDKLNVMEHERDAREIANKREQIIREQSLRTRKHITLEEIGRRKAIGTFKELNVIVKGDVDGSVEALSDALLKLSTEEVQVRIIHKGVGQVSESDVLLASAADAVIVAFQVRPSTNARRLAETEQIEIRTYSIIYQAIDEIRDAMEGMLAPTFEESITANIEVRSVFKISKVGTVAGCYVLDGNVKRNNKIRVLRDFVVVHEGEISALKRFKDDVAEVKFGYECGLSIKNFNDIIEGDIIECYEMKEVKRTL
ncbi:translation initiation factor IF-2 [Flectobacillus major]|uniref:translation initiation factor IF-2 n=1 Tax=Flectobacillus major TaxID=103 RepID=UPI000479117F|nr:translation initiation factor IF-2 [Flectobacillus major]